MAKGKFTAAQEVLDDMLAPASRVSTPSGTIPVSGCVRMTAGSGGMKMEASNFETWLTISTRDFVAKDAESVIIPCQAFYSVVSGVSDNEVIDFSVSASRLQVKTLKSKYHFGILPNDQWPEIKREGKESAIEVKARDLRDAIKFATASIDPKNTRYFLCGVSFRQADDGALRLSGCDGHKASLVKLQINKKGKVPDDGIIISSEVTNILQDIITRFLGADDMITLTLTEGKVRIDLQNDEYDVSMTGRLIDGQFPEMDRLIPYDRPSVIATVNRDELIAAIKRLTIMGDTQKLTPIHFSFDASELTLKTKNEMGDAEERVACALPEGVKGVKVCMSAPKALPIISSFTSPAIFISMPAEGENIPTPIIFSDEGEQPTKDSAKFAIVMPIRENPNA